MPAPTNSRAILVASMVSRRSFILSGENVAAGRWTAAQKQRLGDSRVTTTRNLVRVMTQMKPSPRVLLCASAIGYYGERGDEVLTEESSVGTGFLPELCHAWEQEAQTANAFGARVVNLRFGLVLSHDGGPLAKMLLLFKLGIGGRLASGKQYMSWIAIEDAVRATEAALATESGAGGRDAARDRGRVRRVRHAAVPPVRHALDMHCSCPDWGVPCKHLAAVCYVLAEEFDRDPFVMLAWRGKARDDLLAALREVRSAPRSPAPRPGPGRRGSPGPSRPHRWPSR